MTKTDKLLSRKGPSKPENIQKDILTELSMGTIESANLTEWLAVDHMQLIENVLSCYPDYLQECRNRLGTLHGMGVRTCIFEISKVPLARATKKGDEQLFEFLATHGFDSVRCWAAYMVGGNVYPDVQAKLEAIRPFAADSHFCYS